MGDPPQSAVFSGPSQVEDAQITADAPTTTNGSGASINVDGQTPHAHGLLKFPTLVGSGAGQVPAGAFISSAVLQVNCTNFGNMMRVYRLTQSWNENEATWNQRSTGVAWGVSGRRRSCVTRRHVVNGDCTATGLGSVDVTQSRAGLEQRCTQLRCRDHGYRAPMASTSGAASRPAPLS